MDNYIKNIILTILIIALFFFSFFALKYIFIYLSPFIIAGVLASLINPAVNWLEEKIPIHRGFIVLIVLIFLISIFVVLIILGVSQLYVELNYLLRNLPDYKTIFDEFQWIVGQNNRLLEIIDELDISPQIQDMLQSNLQLLYDKLRSFIIGLINDIMTFLTKLPMILIILFLSFIASFFITRDKKIIHEFVINLFPEKWRPRLCKIQNELSTSAIGFIKAELTLISITGLISGVALSLMGYRFALIIGITAAILDLIPIIGPSLLFVPWILYNFISGNIPSGISLLVLILIMGAVRSGAEGKVMGHNLGIHPLSTMIALYIGYRTMGSIGFIIGPAYLIMIKALFQSGFFPSWEENK